MKCSNCGADALEQTSRGFACPYCRSRFSASDVGEVAPDHGPAIVREIRYVRDRDRLGLALGCLCWLFFPAAWVVWAVSIQRSPNRAKTALIIAAIQTGLLVAAVMSAIVGSVETVASGMAGKG